MVTIINKLFCGTEEKTYSQLGHNTCTTNINATCSYNITNKQGTPFIHTWVKLFAQSKIIINHSTFYSIHIQLIQQYITPSNYYITCHIQYN